MPLFTIKHNRSVNGLLLNWLISYGIILLLAFIFIMSSYFFLSRNLRQESFRFHEAKVQQSQLSADYLLSEIRTITHEIIDLPETKSLGSYVGELGPRQYYLKHELMVELNKLHRTHLAIESVFVYFREGDYVVNSSFADSAEFYFEQFYSESGMTRKGWKALLFRESALESFSLVQFNRSRDKAVPHIQFVTTALGGGDLNSGRISIGVTVKESTVATLLDSGYGEGRFFILDGPDQTYLTGNDQGLPADLPGYHQLKNQDSPSTYWKDQILTVFPSRVNDWLFVSLYPQTMVEFRLHRIRWIIMGLVAIFWIIGTVTAYFLARRNYRPVTRLMEFVSGKGDDGNFTHFRREEYRYIEESFSRLRQEKASIQDQLTLQQEGLRLNFLSRLVSGRLKETTHTLEEQCQFQGIYFEEDAFLTVILKMEETVLKEEQLSRTQGAQWLNAQLQTLLADVYYGVGWALDIDNLTVLFLNLQSPDDDPQLILKGFLGTLKKNILRETGIVYTVGSSTFKLDLNALATAFDEAQESLDYRMVKGKGAVISYYDIMEKEKGSKVFDSLNWERRFINLFSSGSYEEAGRLMQQVLDRLENVRNLAVFKIRLFGLINIFLDGLSDSFDDDFLNELDCENRLLACTTLNETRTEMETLFREIRMGSLERANSSLREKVTEIMEEYYKDPNLSVGFLADQLELSISNFSWMFKEETGMGPLDCIHRIRLREAKILLKKSGMTVKEIARKCGYLSDIAFIRVFKKYEGVTPGQYRGENKASGVS